MVVWHLSARFVPDTCIPGHVLTFMQELFVTPPLYYLVNNLPNREYFSNVVGGGYLMYSTLRNGVSNRRGSFFWKSSRWLRLRFHVRGNFSLFGASALCNGMRRYWRYSLWRWKLWNIRKYECKVMMHCVTCYYAVVPAGYTQNFLFAKIWWVFDPNATGLEVLRRFVTDYRFSPGAKWIVILGIPKNRISCLLPRGVKCTDLANP